MPAKPKNPPKNPQKNRSKEPAGSPNGEPQTSELSDRQTQILEFIATSSQEKGYPPSVREIGAAVGLASPSTVHNHLATLEKLGFIKRDLSKPRAMEIRYDPNSGASVQRGRVRHVPLVGDVAAGTDVLANENIEETMPVPAELCGDGELFMLRVRGESMLDDGIYPGDHLVVRSQPTAENGEIIVAGIPGEEATVKRLKRENGKVTLIPANENYEPMVFTEDEVAIFGKVVTVIRKL